MFALSPQAANWILVPRWWGDPQDEELLHLIPVLGQLGHAVRTGGVKEGTGAPGGGSSPVTAPSLSVQDDVRPEIQRHFPHCQLRSQD